jgi:putative ABC transport system ATP-binding protein
MSDASIVALNRVTKTYRMGDTVFDALHEVDFEVRQGEYVAIMGPSGCGKSTLLNVLGCLDRPSSGSYLLGGTDVSTFDDDALSEIRGAHLGLFFSPTISSSKLTVLENIEVPLYYQGLGPAVSRKKARALAERVGLGHRLHHKPSELSGGQQQRVGIARSLVNDPLVLLADEPTGNLDSNSGAEILELFDELRGQKKTIIMVTHDPDIGQRAGRIIRLRDGKIEEDIRNGLA